jgi:hypothetical protein
MGCFVSIETLSREKGAGRTAPPVGDAVSRFTLTANRLWPLHSDNTNENESD